MHIIQFSSSEQMVNDWLNALRSKWGEIPAGIFRADTKEIIELPDSELLALHKNAVKALTKEDFSRRGWYHCIYKDILKDKQVLDVGSGFGIDGISFALAGARVTFLDIVENNLQVLRKLCRLYKVQSADFCYLNTLESLSELRKDFDIIWCQGSMITAPMEITKVECSFLLQHLKPNGRWIELAYPKSRWVREGQMPFDKWGDKTDGGAPWIEWMDLDKLLARLAPTEFDVVLCYEYHNADFIWFDLQRRG
jgi:2-polyprenyl-3-methyl-5-hydroxy-6-metoxy-1,4-benzoquinol methylase